MPAANRGASNGADGVKPASAVELIPFEGQRQDR
jgi:hypothetical protein